MFLRPLMSGPFVQSFLEKVISWIKKDKVFMDVYFKNQLEELIKQYPNGFTRSLMESRLNIPNAYYYKENKVDFINYKSCIVQPEWSVDFKKECIDNNFSIILLDYLYSTGKIWNLKDDLIIFIEKTIELFSDENLPVNAKYKYFEGIEKYLEEIQNKFQIDYHLIQNNLVFNIFILLKENTLKIKNPNSINNILALNFFI